MSYVIGNSISHIRYRGSNCPSGITIAGSTTPAGYVQCSAKAGDVVYIKASDFLYNKFDQGAWCQAVGSSVTVEYTLQNEALASNPDPSAQACVSWCNSMTVAPGTIKPLSPVASTCLKVTFSGNGEFYVLAR